MGLCSSTSNRAKVGCDFSSDGTAEAGSSQTDSPETAKDSHTSRPAYIEKVHPSNNSQIPVEAQKEIKKEYEEKGKLDLDFLRHIKQTYGISHSESQKFAQTLSTLGIPTVYQPQMCDVTDIPTSSDMPSKTPMPHFYSHPTKFDEKLLGGEYTCNMAQKPLGKGAFGLVMLGYTTEKHKWVAGVRVAIKKISTAFHDQYSAKKMLRELRIAGLLRKHPYICGLMDAITQNDTVLLVFEYCESNLRNFIGDESRNLTESEIAEIMKKLLCALKYIHSGGFVHRDIKPENILVNSLQNGELEVKICDFGLARQYEENPQVGGILREQMTQHVVTRWYRAPEISLQIMNQENVRAVDLWSIGLVFAELLQMVKGNPTDKEDEVDYLGIHPTNEDACVPTSEPSRPPSVQGRSTFEIHSLFHSKNAEPSEYRSLHPVLLQSAQNWSCTTSPANVLSSDSTGDYDKQDEVNSLGNHPTNEDSCEPMFEPSKPPSVQGPSAFEIKPSFPSKNAEPSECRSLLPVFAIAQNFSSPNSAINILSSDSTVLSGTAESHSGDYDVHADVDIKPTAIRKSSRTPVIQGEFDHAFRSPHNYPAKVRQKDQIQAVIDFVGPPSDEYLETIPHEETRNRIRSYRQNCAPCIWRDRFPAVSEEALGLLRQFLPWETEERLDVGPFLDHPFFNGTSLGPDEDETQWIHTFDNPERMDFEDPSLSTEQLRQMIFDEVAAAHAAHPLPRTSSVTVYEDPAEKQVVRNYGQMSNPL